MQAKTLAHFDSALNTAINMSSTNDVKPYHNARYTVEDIIMMKLYYHWVHKTYNELATMFNTDYSMVYGIINKKKYKNVPLNFMTKIPERFHEETNGFYRSHKVKGHK